MKYKLLSGLLFSLSAVSPFLVPSLTPSAIAGCTAIDVGVQVAIDGSRKPGRQTNEVNQEFGPNCEDSVGSHVRTTGTQVCVSGNCEQRRRSNQYVDGDTGRRIGVKTPNIPIKVHVPVHVHNPAADPNFPFNRNKK